LSCPASPSRASKPALRIKMLGRNAASFWEIVSTADTKRARAPGFIQFGVTGTLQIVDFVVGLCAAPVPGKKSSELSS